MKSNQILWFRKKPLNFRFNFFEMEELDFIFPASSEITERLFEYLPISSSVCFNEDQVLLDLELAKRLHEEDTNMAKLINETSSSKPAAERHSLNNKKQSSFASQLQEIRKKRAANWKMAKQLHSPTENGAKYSNNYRHTDKSSRNKVDDVDRDNREELIKKTWTLQTLQEKEISDWKLGGKYEFSESLGRTCLHYVNCFRKECGQSPLLWSSALFLLCYEHSENMAQGNVQFGHDGFDGRFKRFPMGSISGGENVYMQHGSDTSSLAFNAVESWKKSPGHRKNMLSNWTHCAVGFYWSPTFGYYAAQLFALIP